MLPDDYIIVYLVWFSGLFFVWLSGAIISNPRRYVEFRMSQFTPVSERQKPPGFIRVVTILYIFSDLLVIYLISRGYGLEPSLWGALVAHIALWPDLVRRRLMSPASLASSRRKLQAVSERSLMMTALGSLSVGILILVFYYNL